MLLRYPGKYGHSNVYFTDTVRKREQVTDFTLYTSRGRRSEEAGGQGHRYADCTGRPLTRTQTNSDQEAEPKPRLGGLLFPTRPVITRPLLRRRLGTQVNWTHLTCRLRMGHSGLLTV